MNWTDKIDQQQNALLLTFYMFIAMTLVVIRTGLITRGLSASFPFEPVDDGEASFPLAGASDGAPPGCGPPSATLSAELDRLYAGALALLCMARAIARQIAGLERAIFELMKLADTLAQSLRGDICKTGGRCNLLGKRLDAP